MFNIYDSETAPTPQRELLLDNVDTCRMFVNLSKWFDIFYPHIIQMLFQENNTEENV